MIRELLSKHPLISDQVNKDQLQVILTELEQVVRRDISGAVVEFGCYIGTTSLFIRRLLDAYDDTRAFHVYDSFAGLPPKVAEDASPAGTQFQGGELSVSKKEFLREFQKANIRPPYVHKAWFSNLMSTDVPEQIAFAFLDGDFYESIRDSLRLVLPRMTTGGVIIFDDYAREALPGVAKAARELLSQQQFQSIRTAHNLGILQF